MSHLTRVKTENNLAKSKPLAIHPPIGPIEWRSRHNNQWVGNMIIQYHSTALTAQVIRSGHSIQ